MTCAATRLACFTATLRTGSRRVVLMAAVALLAAGPVEATEIAQAAAAVVAQTPVERARLNHRVFDRVWGEVRRDYYDPHIHGLDWRAIRSEYRPQALAARTDGQLYAVLNRMLDLLDDEHAGAASPAVTRRQDLLRARHAIIGITFYPEPDGGYRIERVRAGSPAAEAGVQTGWRLAATAEGWTPDRDVVEGQAVDLNFLDPTGQTHALSLVPRQMEALPAFVADRSKPGVLVLRVEGFEPGLGRWMGAQLMDLPADVDVVVDLRANPGGLLREADAVLSCFLPDRQAWATQRGRSGRTSTLRIQRGCGGLAGPVRNDLAVLVDDTSRSAAELTPAALQEAGRAVIVGETTAGAVLISRETRLPDGGKMILSRADFVTSGGVRLEKHGVRPDIVVADAGEPEDAGGPDPALDAAIIALRLDRAPVSARADANVL